MTSQFVNIHTHRPTGRGIELRTAGIHPWDADKENIAALGTLPADVQAIGETGLDYARKKWGGAMPAAPGASSNWPPSAPSWHWRATGNCP